MRSRTVVPAFLLSLLLAFSGAAGAQAKAPPPAALDPAIDACAQCRMSVKDSGYAAQAIADDGRVYWFDDVGCLLAFLSAESSLKIAARYVQDAESRSWVALEKAFFVRSKEVATPMGYGIHAFALKAEVESFAKARKDGAKAVALGDLVVVPAAGMKM